MCTARDGDDDAGYLRPERVFGAGHGQHRVGFALGPRLAIVAETDAMLAWPTTDVKVDPDIVASFGGLSLFTHAGLLATF